MKQLFYLLAGISFIFQSCDNGEVVKNQLPQDLDSLLVLYPDSIELIIEHGNKMIAEFDYEAAMADAAKAFRLDSSSFEARMLYAEVLNNKPDRTVAEISNAQRHYQILVKKDASNTKALVGLAATYTQQQDWDNSFKYVNQALKVNPKYRDAYVLKGTNYRILGNIELTKSSYETAVQQDPEFYEAYIVLGSLYQAEENELCIQYYTTAYQLRPKEMDAVYALAYAKNEFGDLEGAKELYRVMAHDTSDYFVQRGLFHQGYIKQFKENDIDSAIYFYDSALTTDPRYVEAWHNLGLCYAEKGDKTRALQSFAKALKYNPDFKLSREAADKLR